MSEFLLGMETTLECGDPTRTHAIKESLFFFTQKASNNKTCQLILAFSAQLSPFILDYIWLEQARVLSQFLWGHRCNYITVCSKEHCFEVINLLFFETIKSNWFVHMEMDVGTFTEAWGNIQRTHRDTQTEREGQRQRQIQRDRKNYLTFYCQQQVSTFNTSSLRDRIKQSFPQLSEFRQA